MCLSFLAEQYTNVEAEHSLQYVREKEEKREREERNVPEGHRPPIGSNLS